MSKQTAVDFIFSQLPSEYTTTRIGFDVYQQAKEMDKMQRIEDMSKMQIISDVDFDGNVTFIFNPEQYYNETFNK